MAKENNSGAITSPSHTQHDQMGSGDQRGSGSLPLFHPSVYFTPTLAFPNSPADELRQNLGCMSPECMAPAIADLQQVVDDSALLTHDGHGYSRRACAITGAFQVQEIGRLPKIIMPPKGRHY